MLMHKILQNHLLYAFVANLKINAIYALYPESFCDKNLAIRKVFAFCDSGSINKVPGTLSSSFKYKHCFLNPLFPQFMRYLQQYTFLALSSTTALIVYTMASLLSWDDRVHNWFTWKLYQSVLTKCTCESPPLRWKGTQLVHLNALSINTNQIYSRSPLNRTFWTWIFSNDWQMP